MANPLQIPMLGLSLKNLFSRPATRRYPAELRPRYERTRGHVEVDLAACVFCGLCARRCPANAIEVSREARTFSIEHLRCIACEVCVDVCNKDSLRMHVDAPPVFTRAEAGPDGLRPRGREVRARPAEEKPTAA